MKRKCKSCPYSFSTEQFLGKLDELAFWIKFGALNKRQTEAREITVQIKKIDAILKLLYPDIYNSLSNSKESKQ